MPTYLEIEPNHEHGYTWSYLEAHLTDEQLKRLSKWLTGQTLGISSTGESIVYPHDYKKWRAYFTQGMDAPVYD